MIVIKISSDNDFVIPNTTSLKMKWDADKTSMNFDKSTISKLSGMLNEFNENQCNVTSHDIDTMCNEIRNM